MTRNELILKIQAASKEDDKEFQEIIATLLDQGFLTETDLCREIGASKPTIRRWKEGKSSPLPLMRLHLFKRLIKKLQENDL
ncbi:MAG: hypothetical protein HYY86_02705 [Candidatus Harrisonbacteria bacterium]|nr:hypothetical protein [Candidatus Harrisonbacteria bacterium]